jgi:hypothetical protein
MEGEFIVPAGVARISADAAGCLLAIERRRTAETSSG